MRLIKQENELGCGVACIASVLSLSYKNALKLFPKKRVETKGFICKEIVQALKKGGLQYEFKYVKPKLRNKIYREGVIVFIRRSKKYPEGHYLARGYKKWMDPWINFPEKNRQAGFRKKLPGHPIYLILNTGATVELNVEPSYKLKSPKRDFLVLSRRYRSKMIRLG